MQNPFTLKEAQPIVEALTEFVKYQYVYETVSKQLTDQDFQKSVLDKENNFTVHFEKEPEHHSFTLGGTDFALKAIMRHMAAEKIDFETAYSCFKDTVQQCALRCLVLDFENNAIEIWGPRDLSADSFQVGLTDALFIRSHLKETESIEAVLQKNPTLAVELARKIYLAESYVQDAVKQNKPCSQKGYEKFQLDFERSRFQHKLQGMLQVAFVQLVEKTRRFLYTALTERAWQNLAQTKQQAQELLKKNKDLIYQKAQEFGYIPKAQTFIEYQHLRDELEHPVRLAQTIPFPADTTSIYENFRALLMQLTQTKDLRMEHVYSYETEADAQQRVAQQYQKPFKILDTSESVITPDIISAHQLVHQMDMLGALFTLYQFPMKNGKEMKEADKLSYLAQQGIITSSEASLLSNAVLNRNKVAHAQTDNQTYTEIEKKRLQITNLIHQISNDFQK